MDAIRGFPEVHAGIEEVRQLDDKRLQWVAEIGGKRKEWEAEIFEQVPDQKIAWRSTSGAANAGIVSFRPIAANRTHVTVRMEYEPEGVIENMGAALGAVSTRIEGDLKRFRDFIQSRIQETGALARRNPWRPHRIHRRGHLAFEFAGSAWLWEHGNKRT